MSKSWLKRHEDTTNRIPATIIISLYLPQTNNASPHFKISFDQLEWMCLFACLKRIKRLCLCLFKLFVMLMIVCLQIPDAWVSAAEEIPRLRPPVHPAAVSQERGFPDRRLQGAHLLPQEGHQQPGHCRLPGLAQALPPGDADPRGLEARRGLGGRVE